MELDDCAFPLLDEIVVTSNPGKLSRCKSLSFNRVNLESGYGAFRFVERQWKDFVGQGKAIENAANDCRVIVVGNPCNTNCMIAASQSDRFDSRFTAMTRLDQNRAVSMLAKKAGVLIEKVRGLAIFETINVLPDGESAVIASVMKTG